MEYWSKMGKTSAISYNETTTKSAGKKICQQANLITM